MSKETKVPPTKPYQLGVTLPQDIHNLLATYFKNRPDLKRQKVIPSLLKYFLGLQPTEQEEILSGLAGSHRTRLDRQTALLETADHAYSNKYYEWALQEYLSYKENSTRGSRVDRFVDYKVGVCWLRLAHRLHKQAYFTDLREQNFDALISAAETAIQNSIDNLDTLLKQIENKTENLLGAVGHYNQACAYSLRAQIRIEQNLARQTPAYQKIFCENEMELEEDKFHTYLQDVWHKENEEDHSLANDWRSLVSADTKKHCAEDLQYANQSFWTMSEKIKKGDAEGAHWLYIHARADKDLMLLRLDSENCDEAIVANEDDYLLMLTEKMRTSANGTASS